MKRGSQESLFYAKIKYQCMRMVAMVEKILFVLLMINMAVWVVGIYITIKRKRAQRLEAIRTSTLYQTILNETQTGVVAHDIKTGEIFYANDRLKEIYSVEGDVSNLEPDSFLMRERGKKHLDLDYEALKNGVIAAAAVDVTEPEPLPAESPLWTLDNLLITPHISGQNHLPATFERVVNIAAENLRRYLAGEELLNVVDWETGYKK